MGSTLALGFVPLIFYRPNVIFTTRMKRNLLLTYDYELFLGSRSGSVDACLIRPTSRLLKIMEEASVKAVFFVDSVYLMRLKAQASTSRACENDFLRISAQIQKMIGMGHDVYPHIHPHWLDAVYLPEKNEWNLENTARYRFCNISREDQEAVFSGSFALLQEIINKVNPAYKIEAHRAGGWSVQPFGDFLPLFRKFGFRYDFSVLDKAYMFTKAQYFDFSAIPNKNMYRFTEDPTTEQVDGEFLEIVNSTVPVHPLVRFLDRLLLKILYKVAHDHSYGRGIGQIAEKIDNVLPLSDKGFDMKSNNYQYICIEQMSFIKMRGYLNFLKKHDYMHFVSHPKMITHHNLITFRRFLKKINRVHTLETDFKKMF